MLYNVAIRTLPLTRAGGPRNGLRSGVARSPVRTYAVIVAVLACALGGCADGTQEPPVTRPNPSPEPVRVLRLGDDGAGVALEIGGTATVSLPATFTWSEPLVDAAAVTVSQDVSDEGGGSRSWTVTARAVGTATVTLTGSPTWASETPSCAEPDVAWTAGFTVS